MERQVTLTKRIDCRDETCGNCAERDFGDCTLFTKKNGDARMLKMKNGVEVRCKECLAAEEAAKA